MPHLNSNVVEKLFGLKFVHGSRPVDLDCGCNLSRDRLFDGVSAKLCDFHLIELYNLGTKFNSAELSLHQLQLVNHPDFYKQLVIWVALIRRRPEWSSVKVEIQQKSFRFSLPALPDTNFPEGDFVLPFAEIKRLHSVRTPMFSADFGGIGFWEQFVRWMLLEVIPQQEPLGPAVGVSLKAASAIMGQDPIWASCLEPNDYYYFCPRSLREQEEAVSGDTVLLSCGCRMFLVPGFYTRGELSQPEDYVPGSASLFPCKAHAYRHYHNRIARNGVGEVLYGLCSTHADGIAPCGSLVEKSRRLDGDLPCKTCALGVIPLSPWDRAANLLRVYVKTIFQDSTVPDHTSKIS